MAQAAALQQQAVYATGGSSTGGPGAAGGTSGSSGNANSGASAPGGNSGDVFAGSGGLRWRRFRRLQVPLAVMPPSTVVAVMKALTALRQADKYNKDRLENKSKTT